MTGLYVQSHSAESRTETISVNQRPKENNEQVNNQLSLSLPTQTSRRLAKFIGAKALARCDLNGLTVNALLDTGAQVSMIDKSWKEKYLPNTPIRPLSEIFDEREELEVHAVNGEVLPFDGWVLIAVSFSGNGALSQSIMVPFLICSIPLAQPLLGFNVLEEVIQNRTKELVPALTTLLSDAISVPAEKVELLMNFIQTDKPSMYQRLIRTGNYETTVPAGQVAWVKCQVPSAVDQSDPLLLFEPNENSGHLTELEIEEGLLELQTAKRPYVIIPVRNNTKHPVTVPRKTALGSVQTVARVIENNPLESPRPRVTVVKAATAPVKQSVPALWQPRVDLSHLSDEEQEKVEKMLWEESAAFAQDSHDIGCIPSLQMSISLKDEIPVQRAYSSVPKPLFKEVKEYVQDLLMKGWIVKSKSSYAAPVVCVLTVHSASVSIIVS